MDIVPVVDRLGDFQLDLSQLVLILSESILVIHLLVLVNRLVFIFKCDFPLSFLLLKDVLVILLILGC